MEQLQAQNCELVRRAQEAEGLKQQLCSQMAALEGRYEQTSEVNSQMQQEIDALRQSLQVRARKHHVARTATLMGCSVLSADGVYTGEDERSGSRAG